MTTPGYGGCHARDYQSNRPRRVDPLLELRLFRSVPFSAAILVALFALCGFGAFLFVTTLYLQNVRGMSALTAGLSLLPVGGLIMVLSPFTGRLVGARGPRLPLVVSAGRQTGTTLGVAIAGTIVGSAASRGGMAFTSAAHGVWWLVLGLGVGIGVLGLLSTGRWALGTARQAAALFEEVDRGAHPRTAPVATAPGPPQRLPWAGG